LRPAGFDKSEGLVSSAYAKDPFDPTWANDADVIAFHQWEKDNLTQTNPHDTGVAGGYITSWLMAYVLEKAGSNLTRAHILDVATHLTDVHAPLLLPGITVNTTPTDYSVINRFQMQRFEGGRWVLIGKVIGGD
jgi:branched-chain amino acid transport system substrate-binding protein